MKNWMQDDNAELFEKSRANRLRRRVVGMIWSGLSAFGDRRGVGATTKRTLAGMNDQERAAVRTLKGNDITLPELTNT